MPLTFAGNGLNAKSLTVIFCTGYYDEPDGITIFAESTENISEQAVWNCITDAVAFTSRKAYEYENSEYYPEPIELVDDELILHFMECYNRCFPDDMYVKKVAGYLELSGVKSEWKKFRTDGFKKL